MKPIFKQMLLNLKNHHFRKMEQENLIRAECCQHPDAVAVDTSVQTAFEPQMVQITATGISYWMGCQTRAESDGLGASNVKKGINIDDRCRSDEKPLHQVTFSRDFLVSAYVITFDQWDACVVDGGCRYSPSDEGWGRGSRPVINVSWNDITGEYLPWLNRKTGKRYRLLTESEWEYVARAGTQTVYNAGDAICCGASDHDDANCDRAVGATSEVGRYRANRLGLYDIHGNVWEWVEDSYASGYSKAPVDGSAVCWGTNRVVRGGSWVNGTNLVRSANRSTGFPSYRYSNLGFRVARTK